LSRSAGIVQEETMKSMTVALTLILLAGSAASGVAHADGHFHRRGGVRFGVFIGGPWPWYYPPPWYYYPPPYDYYPRTIIVPSSPPQYVERGDEDNGSAPLPSGYWYYCGNPEGYYPYVKDCPGGWQKVPPQPPPPGR
jgi:hypothetical protein